MSSRHYVCYASYAVMALVAIGLVLWTSDASYSFYPLKWEPPRLSPMLWVVGIVALVHSLTRFSLRYKTVRQASAEAASLLAPLTPFSITLLALASSVGEELLFRGWLMNEIGLYLSSILFGLVHWPPNRDWAYWPLFALLLGLAFGQLAIWSGSIIYPILAHFGINFLNLFLIARFDSRFQIENMKKE